MQCKACSKYLYGENGGEGVLLDNEIFCHEHAEKVACCHCSLMHMWLCLTALITHASCSMWYVDAVCRRSTVRSHAVGGVTKPLMGHVSRLRAKCTTCAASTASTARAASCRDHQTLLRSSPLTCMSARLLCSPRGQVKVRNGHLNCGKLECLAAAAHIDPNTTA